MSIFATDNHGTAQWADLYRRLSNVHPEIALRALRAVTLAVEVFEKNGRRHGEAFKAQSRVKHLTHAINHLERPRFSLGNPADLIDSVKEGGDGLTHLAHGIARVLLAVDEEGT